MCSDDAKGEAEGKGEDMRKRLIFCDGEGDDCNVATIEEADAGK
jgi:hypothetical protein